MADNLQEKDSKVCEEDRLLAHFESLARKKRQFMQEIAKIDKELAKIKEKVKWKRVYIP